VGAHNSWSGLGDASGGVALETLSLLNRVIRVEASVAVVQPGLTVRALVKALAARSLCIASLPILLDQTVAGAAAGGSHGSSLRHGTFADCIVALTLVRSYVPLNERLRRAD
jgi:FAD/FMN-containing dehydrogenase